MVIRISEYAWHIYIYAKEECTKVRLPYTPLRHIERYIYISKYSEYSIILRKNLTFFGSL